MLQSSELILNPDGSVFHLRLLPGQIAKTIFLVGDPDRVEMVSSHLDKVESVVRNREFITHTGSFKGTRISVISTGIGTDNIDIVLNELDALVNIDFDLRQPKSQLKKLKLIRLGTSGAIQPDIPLGTFLLTKRAIGLDGLLNYYEGQDSDSDKEFVKAFTEYVDWDPKLPVPYLVNVDETLANQFSGEKVMPGITISATGFYGPQGRIIRLPLTNPGMNDKITNFRYGDEKVTNFEMESSAIYGLASLLGHNALTLCAIIANRATGKFLGDYKGLIEQLIEFSLNMIVNSETNES
jgi:uridine phosphorylase